jgi:hypothetical protein
VNDMRGNYTERLKGQLREVNFIIRSICKKKTITMFSYANSFAVPVKEKYRKGKNKEEQQEKCSTTAVALDCLRQLLVPALNIICSFNSLAKGRCSVRTYNIDCW